MRLSPLFVFPLLALPAVPTVAATPPLTHAQLNQYQQVGKRFGLTAVQVAEVYDFIDRNAAVISAAAAKERVNQAAFKAIARELGLRSYNEDRKAVLEAIKANATNAAKFEKDNRELRKQISALESSVLRAPAGAILARADAAYAAGDLETAQKELNSLLELRSGELAGSVDAYQAAVETAIALARSRGDRTMIDRIAEQSDPVLARMEKRARLTRWRNQIERASIRFNDGERFGKVADFEEAVSIYVNVALPLLPKAEYPNEWALTQIRLGMTFVRQGERTAGEAGTALLEQGVNATDEALSVYSKTEAPDRWADTNIILGLAFVEQGRRVRGETGAKLAAQAVKVFDAALTVGTVSNFVCGWAVEHYAAMALMKRSPNMTANWAFAMVHSRGGIFHSFSDLFKIR